VAEPDQRNANGSLAPVYVLLSISDCDEGASVTMHTHTHTYIHTHTHQHTRVHIVHNTYTHIDNIVCTDERM
jgi:hypothetical protein